MEPELYCNKRKEANERERRRMQHLNDCYDRLREVFYWSFNVKDRPRSKVQVLKDCLVYIRELEKRVPPHVLHDLQENFHHYVDKDSQLSEEDDTSPCTGSGVKCVTSCSSVGEQISGMPMETALPPTHSQQLGRFEQDHQYLSKRRKYVKTTCEYEVEYYPHALESPFPLDRKGYDKLGYSNGETFCEAPENTSTRRYCFNDSMAHHLPPS